MVTLFLFFFLAVLSLSYGMQDLSLQCVGSSLWHAGFSLVVVHRLLSSCGVWVFSLSSCGMQTPGCMGSLVEMRRLSSCGTRA